MKIRASYIDPAYYISCIMNAAEDDTHQPRNIWAEVRTWAVFIKIRHGLSAYTYFRSSSTTGSGYYRWTLWLNKAKRDDLTVWDIAWLGDRKKGPMIDDGVRITLAVKNKKKTEKKKKTIERRAINLHGCENYWAYICKLNNGAICACVFMTVVV